MVNYSFKNYREPALILIIISLYLGSGFLYEFFNSSSLELFESSYIKYPSITILTGLFFSLFDRMLPRLPWLWKALLKIPLIRGFYQGHIKYFINGEIIEKNCTMKIFQSASKIKISSSFWDDDKESLSTATPSESYVEDFLKKEDGEYQLHFYYKNDGSVDGTIPLKEGYNVLNIDSKQKTLSGYYFSRNSEAKGNSGKVNLKLFRNPKHQEHG